MLDKDILKWIIVIGSAPMWMPFLRALWEELNDAMRLDGGLVGPEPGPIEREKIERELALEEPRLVSETLAHYKNRRSSAAGRSRKSGPNDGARDRGPQAGPQAGNRRKAFGGAPRPGGFSR